MQIGLHVNYLQKRAMQQDEFPGEKVDRFAQYRFSTVQDTLRGSNALSN